MDPQSFLEERLDRAAVPLAVGDLVVLLVLLTVGTSTHRTMEFLLEVPTYLLGVWAPFVVGWVVAAPLIGAYSPGAVESAKASVPLVIRSWIPAAVIAIALRVFAFGDPAPWEFVAIIVVLGAIALGGWRALYFKLR